MLKTLKPKDGKRGELLPTRMTRLSRHGSSRYGRYENSTLKSGSSILLTLGSEEYSIYPDGTGFYISDYFVGEMYDRFNW